MVFIPPPHMLARKAGAAQKPANQHDLTVGMFVVFVIMLGIAMVIFIAGPRSHEPPPPLIGYVVSGIALVFGIIAFFSWMKEQSEPDGADRNNTNSES